jgi:hypothetical protein
MIITTLNVEVSVNPYGGRRWAWIQKNNIEFEVVESFVDSKTFEQLPCRIRFKHNKDYTWFLLSQT